jgi:peroxiredoxin
MNKQYIAIGVVVVVLILAVVGLKLVGNTTSTTSSQIVQNTVAVNPTTATLIIGKQAPSFNLTAIDGKQYRLQDMQGKVVILFGMAGWCGECLPEGQALSQIQSTYAGKVQPIGVAFTKGDNKTLLEQYKQTGKVTIPLAVDTDNVGQKYNLTQLDTTYIINKQGIIVYKSEQSMSYQELEQQLQNIL